MRIIFFCKKRVRENREHIESSYICTDRIKERKNYLSVKDAMGL